jgi:hypothetical protein
MIPNYLVSLYTVSLNLSTRGSVYTCEAPGAVYTERKLSPSYWKILTKLNHA